LARREPNSLQAGVFDTETGPVVQAPFWRRDTPRRVRPSKPRRGRRASMKNPAQPPVGPGALPTAGGTNHSTSRRS